VVAGVVSTPVSFSSVHHVPVYISPYSPYEAVVMRRSHSVLGICTVHTARAGIKVTL